MTPPVPSVEGDAVVVASPGNAPREDRAARLAEMYLRSQPGIAVHHVGLLVAAVPQAAAMRLPGVTPGGASASVSGGFAALAARLESDPLIAALASGGLERAEEVVSGATAVLAVGDLAAGIAAEVSGGHQPVVAVLPHFDPGACWLHPGVSWWYVPCAEARDALVVRGVAFDRIAVTGMPSAEVAAATPARFTVGVLPEPFSSEEKHLVRGLGSIGVTVLVAVGEDARLAADLRDLATGTVRLVDGASAAERVAAASTVLVCGAASPYLFGALAAGRPLVVRAPDDDRALRDGDFLVNVGAALPARDDGDAVSRVRFLAAHGDRLAEMAEDSRALGRPGATRTVCERFLAALR